ncbi:hypothetical protein MMC07_008650 [Pseudocyphellaria aurata]|nr:hypothetical protein [Pseudocyphellaria aurata]
MAPDIGLDSQQIGVLSGKGRARIAAQNTAKDAKRKENLEERMRHRGWKGTVALRLELVKEIVRSVGVGMGKWEKDGGQRRGNQDYEKMG